MDVKGAKALSERLAEARDVDPPPLKPVDSADHSDRASEVGDNGRARSG